MSLRAARRMDGIERTLIRRIFDAAPPGRHPAGAGPARPGVAALACAWRDRQAIAEGRTGYTSTAGDPELRAAVAARYVPGSRGRESVVITIGSQEAMFAACLTLLDPGDELLYPDPGYPAYPVVARLVGATAVPYPLRPERGFRLDPEDVLSRVTAQDAPGHRVRSREPHRRDPFPRGAARRCAPVCSARAWPGSRTRSTPGTPTTARAPLRSRSRRRAASWSRASPRT